MSARILESYTGAAVLQANGGVNGAIRRFDSANDGLLGLSLALVRIRSWLLPVVSVMGNVCIVLLIYVGGPMVGTDLTLGELASYAVYVNVLVGGLTSVGWLINSVQRGMIGWERVQEVLNYPLGRERAGQRFRPQHEIGCTIEVRGLGFEHSEVREGEGPALSDVSFQVNAGEFVGVFGVTGSGKSTLLDLISRVYEPPPGTVWVDGEDITSIALEGYWEGLTYVPQEPFLFSESVRGNIALGQEPERVDEARLQTAIEDAALESDLASLAEGLDTVVGERGVTLSGGQRQRCALARAFYRPFRLLLLDDVMSAVDHATEQRLVDAVHRRGRTATTLVVSHRASVLKRADRILVMEQGRLVCQGSHEELVEHRENAYARAYRLQQSLDALDAPEVSA